MLAHKRGNKEERKDAVQKYLSRILLGCDAVNFCGMMFRMSIGKGKGTGKIVPVLFSLIEHGAMRRIGGVEV
jgi:hypothetical protein